jgi:hypothetical protein
VYDGKMAKVLKKKPVLIIAYEVYIFIKKKNKKKVEFAAF